ncbi:MAG TPA: TatD family hydrolase [Phycisphaerales bacterium]|nr:TatD family hydrolase [Phycisphaerales bacterium]
MIDTHCHLTFPDFAGKIDKTLADASEAGVDGVVTISTTVPDAAAALAVAKAHPRVWCSAGVHPLYSDKGTGPGGGHEWAGLGVVIADPKCVAWGELGLDNHYERPPRPLQRQVLEEQLAFILSARERGIDKPIILHCREAFDDLIPVLRSTGIPGERFVFHCFTGTPADMRRVLDFGAMASFTGVATYPNAPEVREAFKLMPPDRYMIETDAPFLTPHAKRGSRPCVPGYARLTAEALASLLGEPWPRFHSRINQNTRRFFGVSSLVND